MPHVVARYTRPRTGSHAGVFRHSVEMTVDYFKHTPNPNQPNAPPQPEGQRDAAAQTGAPPASRGTATRGEPGR